MALKIIRWQKWKNDVNRALDKVSKESMDISNGVAVTLFYQLLQNSPQFSGDFAANWRYSINSPDTTFESTAEDWKEKVADNSFQAFKAGYEEAISKAVARNKGKDTGYVLGDTFFLSNSAVHDEPYALKIEQGEIKFREGNQGYVMARSIEETIPAFKEITENIAAVLAQRRI